LALVSIGITADEEVHYDIKTMSWKKINRILDSKPTITKTEAFALARFHEEAPTRNPNAHVSLLYSIITGKYPVRIGQKEIDVILDGNFPATKVITKISYWKLYHILLKRKMLSITERIKFLNKLPIEYDPIVIKSIEEIISLLSSEGDYASALARMDNWKEDEKSYLFTYKIRYYQAHCIWKHKGDKDIATVKLFDLLGDSISKELGQKIVLELKKIHGEDFYFDLDKDELSYLLPFLNSKEQKKIVLDKIITLVKSYSSSESAYRIAPIILKYKPSLLTTLIRNNLNHFTKNQKLIAALAESLVNSKNYKDALAAIDELGDDASEAEIYKQKSRIYKKGKMAKKYYKSLLKYLSIYPYDTRYQDFLIDILAESKSNSISYASEKQWEEAMNQMPNLPIKGRLVYWYMRFLKFTNKQDRLNELLGTYYSLCPGSYYIGVISREFKTDIEKLNSPSNPFSTKDNLYRYLSLKFNPEQAASLSGQNLSFAYYKDSKELGTRLNTVSNSILNNTTLALSVEYLRIGELKEGLYLADKYIEKYRLGEKEKFEIYVGLGDKSKYTYLSLYYTRLLMKLYRIPDDPLLLPSDINDRLYPRPHRELVLKNANEFGVEEEVIYAIMRQESFFRENAISSSNARGLMQVMPATGRFLASKLGVKNYSLHDPEVSIKFGAKFLADLLKNNDDKLTWASIAYNGGPGNLRKWKRNHYKSDFNHFLEELPSKESRDYCRVIMSNYINYKILKKLQGLD
jgi:hypothetical protein